MHEVDDAYSQFQEGSRLLASGNPHAAALPLERARDLEPTKSSVREALARAYFGAARYARAAEEFAVTVELDPVNDYAHYGLGRSLARMGDLAGARRHLRLATVMRPHNDDYRAALAEVDPES